jgi:hypothetical protein
MVLGPALTAMAVSQKMTFPQAERAMSTGPHMTGYGAQGVGSIGGVSLRDVLRTADGELSECLERMWTRAHLDWLPLLAFDEGSHTGLPHLRDVERNADRMVPDSVKQRLAPAEVFLLLASVLLHDIGKIYVEGPEHADVSAKCIRENWAELGLPDERIARHCATLAQAHVHRTPGEAGLANTMFTALAPYGGLRLPFLAAVLRLADEADSTWTRTARLHILKRMRQEEPPRKAFRRLVDEVQFCLPGECIVLHTSEDLDLNSHDTAVEKLDDASSTLRAVLEAWGPRLEPMGVCLHHVYVEVQGALRCSIGGGNTSLGQLPGMKGEHGRASIKELLQALLELHRGTLGHTSFGWDALEAKVGRPLGPRDRWCLELLHEALNPAGSVLVLPDGEIRVAFMQSLGEVYERAGVKQQQ